MFLLTPDCAGRATVPAATWGLCQFAWSRSHHLKQRARNRIYIHQRPVVPGFRLGCPGDTTVLCLAHRYFDRGFPCGIHPMRSCKELVFSSRLYVHRGWYGPKIARLMLAGRASVIVFTVWFLDTCMQPPGPRPTSNRTQRLFVLKVAWQGLGKRFFFVVDLKNLVRIINRPQKLEVLV